MLAQAPKIITDGLVLYYDMTNIKKSWLGMPTNNLISGYSIGTYLNVPSDVTSVLTTTGEYYLGSPIYKQILTPVTATGVSYLTNGNNPGIGVVTSGGGGLAGRYTGHSIFFKPTVPMYGSPIYTHYSNISGWQSSGNYDTMGDGWFRANTIFYNSSTLSDGKYWAINPLSATINNPITIYWAGPFKEDNNISSFVSPFTWTSRTTATALKDLTGNNTITTNSLIYNSNNTFSFDGSGATYITPSAITDSMLNSSSWTVSIWVKCSSVNKGSDNGFAGHGTSISSQGLHLGERNGYAYFGFYGNDIAGTISIAANTWYNIVYTYNYMTKTKTIYINGVYDSQGGSTGYSGANSNFQLGRYPWSTGHAFLGTMSIMKFYTRMLSAAEVKQNFNALRGRYGL